MNHPLKWWFFVFNDGFPSANGVSPIWAQLVLRTSTTPPPRLSTWWAGIFRTLRTHFHQVVSQPSFVTRWPVVAAHWSANCLYPPETSPLGRAELTLDCRDAAPLQLPAFRQPRPQFLLWIELIPVGPTASASTTPLGVEGYTDRVR